MKSDSNVKRVLLDDGLPEDSLIEFDDFENIETINLSELKSMGYKPFVVGLIAAVTVGIISLIYIETLINFFI